MGKRKEKNLGMDVKEGWGQIGQRINQKLMIGWTGVYNRGRSIHIMKYVKIKGLKGRKGNVGRKRVK